MAKLPFYPPNSHSFSENIWKAAGELFKSKVTFVSCMTDPWLWERVTLMAAPLSLTEEFHTFFVYGAPFVVFCLKGADRYLNAVIDSEKQKIVQLWADKLKLYAKVQEGLTQGKFLQEAVRAAEPFPFSDASLNYFFSCWKQGLAERTPFAKKTMFCNLCESLLEKDVQLIEDDEQYFFCVVNRELYKQNKEDLRLELFQSISEKTQFSPSRVEELFSLIGQLYVAKMLVDKKRVVHWAIRYRDCLLEGHTLLSTLHLVYCEVLPPQYRYPYDFSLLLGCLHYLIGENASLTENRFKTFLYIALREALLVSPKALDILYLQIEEVLPEDPKLREDVRFLIGFQCVWKQLIDCSRTYRGQVDFISFLRELYWGNPFEFLELKEEGVYYELKTDLPKRLPLDFLWSEELTSLLQDIYYRYPALEEKGFDGGFFFQASSLFLLNALDRLSVEQFRKTLTRGPFELQEQITKWKKILKSPGVFSAIEKTILVENQLEGLDVRDLFTAIWEISHRLLYNESFNRGLVQQFQEA